MKYCENCSAATNAARCPICGGKKLREVRGEDYCFLVELPKIEGDMLADILRGNGMECVADPSGSGVNTAMALPLENRKLYVRWKDWDAAADFLREEAARETEKWRNYLQENVGKLNISPKTAKKIVRKAKLGRRGDALEFCRRMIAEAERIEAKEVTRLRRRKYIFCYRNGVVASIDANSFEVESVLFTRR